MGSLGKSHPYRATKSVPSSRAVSPFKEDAEYDDELANRFKANDMIKAKHAEKRAKRTGNSEDIPRYMSPTVTSLFKRQSFLHRDSFTPHKYRGKRSQSLDGPQPRTRQANLDGSRAVQSSCGPLVMADSDSSSAEDALENFVLDASNEWERSLQSMPDDVENAYRETYSDERNLRRNSTGNNRQVEGGLSPLPPRRGTRTPEEDPEMPGDLRPHSAADLSCFLPTQSFRRDPETEDYLLPRRVDTLDVELTQENLTPLDVELATENLTPDHDDSGELHAHPCLHTHSSSFDSTAALTNSPHARSLSPYLIDSPGDPDDRAKNVSHLDHTLPQNICEIQDGTHDGENSDGSKASAEVRCQPGAVISGTPPAANYVKITEEKPREPRRPNHVNEKPSIKRSLILAGIFTSVAIIIGKIFTSKD